MDLSRQVQIIKKEDGQEYVQMNMDVFKAIESYIEDQGLLEAMIKNRKEDDYLELDEALEYYKKLPEA